MQIANLEPNAKVIELRGKITNLDVTTETPNRVKVQEGVLQDDTGQVRISFWEADADKYKVGDDIMIVTGWCKLNHEQILQVSTGKHGRIVKVPPIMPK